MQKSLVIRKTIAITLVQFIILLSLSSLAPLLGRQIFTGPVVNAILFVSTALLGTGGAVLISLMPSLIALSVGLLPVALAPMIPFIVAGNTILVLTFNALRKRNFWLGVASASLLKFLFLSFSGFFIMDLLLEKEIAQNIALMMSWPQLLTALGGGALAYFLLKIKGRENN